ncbi:MULTISPECIES: SMI1/KNR4 family protein [unclassified Streptomyces]|uniref:SMI1/KNR4 family protein n=1 Tax=unclassified Streptomyces TaxID=2593676 RepID=UPI0011E69478|nr:SMI1/KNR4 family protein [Streptomyces sp. sk2.1]TXS81078.1 SMI1/KNR4 family protein [Streptomyces sp. sk2.1]
MNVDHAVPADLEALRAAFDTDSCAPPLGWDAVCAFEAAHGIVLPEPYRTFVAEICDGSFSGPPEYGLVALTEMPKDWGNGRPERVLAKPFPLTGAWVWEGEEDDPRPEEEIEALLEQVFYHGSIVLGTDGCGMYWHLVVAGPHRGHVWNIGGEGAVPFGAEFGHTTSEPGFAGWVGHWAAGKYWYDAS